MAYDEAGSGPAVVLLHGYPFDRSMWCEQMRFLSAHGYRVLAPDLRGLGETHFAGGIATMEDMALDVAALMDESEIDGSVVCGLSMGSYVALELTSLFPSRVRALVLAGARAQSADETERASREQQASRVLAEGMSFVADSMLAKLLAPRTLAEKPDLVKRVREMILGTDPKGAAAAQRGLAGRRDHSKDLSAIEAPTLIVAGREDSIRKPEDSEFLHRWIRDSRLEIIGDAGHLMNMEQPAAFNRALLGFLGARTSLSA